ncbi:ATP-binding protein [Arthrobacter sp. D3-16]
MGNVFLAWEQRLFDELARSTELLTLEVLGTQFAVRWGPAVTLQQRESMRLAWGRCASSRKPLLPSLPIEPSDDQPFTASVAWKSDKPDDGMFQLQAASFEELAENLTSRLTVTAILARAGELTMLHACGVAEPVTGAVVALVAKSGTGKTTAASALARTYGYVTDETAAISPGGSVVPYPKPLSVRQRPGQPKRQVGPDELGLQPAPAKPFIQSIVLLDRVQSDSPVAPVLKLVPLADAVLALIPDSSSQGEIEEPLQSLCRLIDSVGGVWQVTYSEAADLPAALAPLFQTQPRAEPEWDARAAENVHTGHIPAGFIRRMAPKDAVAIGDDLLVMLENDIVRLSGIGPAIWEATATPIRLDQLAEEIGGVHGRPEGYRDAVAAATEQLIEKSVLEQGSS